MGEHETRIGSETMTGSSFPASRCSSFPPLSRTFRFECEERRCWLLNYSAAAETLTETSHTSNAKKDPKAGAEPSFRLQRHSNSSHFMEKSLRGEMFWRGTLPGVCVHQRRGHTHPRRSEQHQVGVRSICGPPGDGVGTPVTGLSFSSSSPVNPPESVGRRENKRVAKRLVPFTGKGERGHVSANTGAP